MKIKRAASGKGNAKRAVGRPSLRVPMLDAALDLIAEDGVSALTFEALSSRTGVSKGGILYHFPSKESLIDALTERLVERYADARRDASESLPDTPSRALKGYAIASIHNRSKMNKASARLRSSGLTNNALVKAYHAQRYRDMCVGMNPDRVGVVYLAVEGLWYMEQAGLSPFDVKERQRLVMLLLRLADGGEIGEQIDSLSEDEQ